MAGVGGAWAIFAMYLFTSGATPSLVDLAVLTALAVASVAVLVERAIRRITDVVCGGQPDAVQLGRRLERIRERHDATVIPFPRSGSDQPGHGMGV